MPERRDGLPLNIIQSRARTYIASRGEDGTNLYVNDSVYRAGEIIQPGRADIVIPRDCVMVFADDEPLKNWGHRCRYLLHDPQDGSLIAEIQALLPPAMNFGEQFTAFHTPIAFNPAGGVNWPVVTLPPWLFPEQTRQWHAILYSGASMNRHLNDLEFLYRTLVNLYGFRPENITVLNYDGTLWYNGPDWTRAPGPIGNWPGDNTPYQIQIDGAGTRANLLAAIASVGANLGEQDKLLIHTNNHGNTVNGVSTIISYSGDDTTEQDIANSIAALPKFATLMVMMEQCYSGGFIEPIMNASTAGCTSVATAVDAATESAGGPEFDPFALDWIQAMAGTTPDGTALNPPASTGAVTAEDAFDWALMTDLGTGDDPQFAANAPCGADATLWAGRLFIPIPLPWRYLFPWEIIPDPGPEQIRQLSTEIQARLRSGALPAELGAVFGQLRAQLDDAVKRAIAD
jgi:hypothetical protein